MPMPQSRALRQPFHAAAGPPQSARRPVRLGAPWAAALMLTAGGCRNAQSSLDPAGPHAEMVATLGNVMYVGGGAILLLVVFLTGWAVLAPARWRRRLARRSAVIAGGIVLPLVVLSALLVYGLGVAGILARPPAPALRVEVVGELWWWRVNYLDPDGSRIASANEIRIPVGQPVEFVLTSPNVIHSFWVPKLGGKLDMIPGRVNRLALRADRPGVYRGQCAEFCGRQHALMALDVVALEPPEFERWRAAERGPAVAPTTAEASRGAEVFQQSGCGACHAIRGTEAAGVLGPDLTHLGSRRAIAAGSFPNGPGHLAAWVAATQHLKPGSLMPSFHTLPSEDLRSLAVYLAGLK